MFDERTLKNNINDLMEFNEKNVKNSCLLCSNGDYPTGAYRYVQCCKPVILFG